MKGLVLAVLSMLSLHAVLTEKVSYNDYKVYRVTPHSELERKALIEFANKVDGISFWDGEIVKQNRHSDLMVSPKSIHKFKSLLRAFKFEHKIIIDNVQRLIEKTTPASKALTAYDWNDYYDLETNYAWLDSLADKYSEVTTVIGGTSYEGRDIKGVKVSFGGANKNKTKVFIEGGIHAREWVAVTTATYFLNEILNSTDSKFRELVETFDWYFFPLVNPDGYVYTWTNDRMWRKTRTPNGNGCYGADPNRNWGYHWLNGGASTNPCSETYAGSSAFSEKETKSLSEFITSISDNLVAYISFHSYSQNLLIPYGDSNAHVENYVELYEIGQKAISTLAGRYGTLYQVGNIVDILYVASGGSFDWVKGTFGTPITYTYELRDTGLYGFLLPANQIIPTALEIVDSVAVILNETKARYVN